MLNSLPLKEYQQEVLDTLDKYLETLEGCYKRQGKLYELDKEDDPDNALHPEKSSYCADAWEKAKSKIHIPIYKDKNGKAIPSVWKERVDGIGRKIPNVCMKVPTGGGKTLLAACALGRISRDYFKSSRGLVLWIVPSTTIYNQTLKALLNKEHPYRKQLDFESGGRTKILERSDELNKADVENNLCIMVLMLQSFNVAKNSKDARKVYSDAGKYKSFFPEVDDYEANNGLLNLVPNLAEDDMLERDVIQGITIKQSLGNVFRLCRPIVIIDEEHKAKSAKAIDNINEFNPKFILEFSATPREGSNKLVDVGGQSLKSEQMIKLPINVHASQKEDWKTTLNTAHAKLESLANDAAKLQGSEGTYIRPIMVIIAEPKKKGEDYDQVEEIKKYLIDICQVQENQIRIKLSENDEIKDEDLLDKTCPVKYIITKDALREGWDCPFAYVLTILTQKNSQTALTQYTGRVLRQPYAKVTPIASLNESYIFCTKADVGDAVSKIKEGLEREGMGDVANEIQDMDGGMDNERVKVTLKRNDNYQNQIFLPTLTTIMPDGEVKPFDYYRDILGGIDWTKYKCSKLPIISDNTKINVREARVDYVKDLTGQSAFDYSYGNIIEVQSVASLNYSLLTSQLTDKIPNAFEARRVIEEVVSALIEKGVKEEAIASAGHDIIRQIKDNAFEWLLEKSEALFVEKLKENKILLKLLATPFANLNWEMGDERTVYKGLHEDPAIGWDKNIFQPQYKSNFNGLELNVAAYINESEAVKWWHRLGTRGTEYFVQGWKKDKIYPDFLVLNEGNKYYFLETKGNHLENPDSAYKSKVLEYLSEHANKSISVGEFKLVKNDKEISFDLIYEDEWKEKLIEEGM